MNGDLILVLGGDDLGREYSVVDLDRSNPGRATGTLNFVGNIRGPQGEQGTQGIQGHQGRFDIELFQRFSTAPTDADRPVGVELDSDGNITTSSTNGWFSTIPTGNDQLYETIFSFDPSNPVVAPTATAWSTPFIAGSQGPTGPAGRRGTDWFSIATPITAIGAVDVSGAGFDGLEQFDILIDGLVNSPNIGEYYTVQSVTGTPGVTGGGATARVVISGNIRGPQGAAGTPGTIVTANPGNGTVDLTTVTIGDTTYNIPTGGVTPTPPFAAGTLGASIPVPTTNGAINNVVVTLTPTWNALTGATITGVALSGQGITGSMTLPVEGTGDPVALAAQNLAVGLHTWTLTVTGTDSDGTARTFTRTANIRVSAPVRNPDNARAGFGTNPLQTDITRFSTASAVRPNMVIVNSTGTASNTVYFWVLLDRDIDNVIFEDGAGPVDFEDPISVDRSVGSTTVTYNAFRSTQTQLDRGGTYSTPLTIRYN